MPTSALALAALLSAGPALAVMPVAPPKVPVPFQGLWAKQGRPCTPGAANYLIRLKGTTLWIFGQESQIQKVERRSARDIVAKAEVLTGDVYEQQTFRWRLSADGKTLTESGGYGTVVRRRCPG